MDCMSQFEAAIAFIEDHLREEIKVEEIASAAGYSYYHFHRVFLALVGESVGSYLRARRLTHAAQELLRTKRSVLDIAVEFQFESQEAFNRAFKRTFGSPPGAFRKSRVDPFLGMRRPLDGLRLRHVLSDLTVQPQLKSIGEIHVVGIRGSATLKSADLPELWAAFRRRMDEVSGKTQPLTCFGICEVDPRFDLMQFSEETTYSEVVGVRVERVGAIPPGMAAKTIPPGKYAVFTHRGPLAKLNLTYDYIWGTWALVSGHEIDFRDDFELYDERFLGPEDQASCLDIYIPIK